MVEILRENDGGGIDGTGERASARLVAPGLQQAVVHVAQQMDFVWHSESRLRICHKINHFSAVPLSF